MRLSITGILRRRAYRGTAFLISANGVLDEMKSSRKIAACELDQRPKESGPKNATSSQSPRIGRLVRAEEGHVV